MDFDEKYAFILHCIQGFYWQNDQATLHAFAVYHCDLDSNELKCDFYCVISYYWKHNKNVVHCFLKYILEKVCLDLPHIKLVKYYSDGASISISNPYLTCLGPTNIKGIALSIIFRGGHALSCFTAPLRIHTTEVQPIT